MYPVAAAHDIAMPESALGRPLPDSYKTFVTEFSNGAYLYQLQEVSAVGEGNQQIAPFKRSFARRPMSTGTRTLPFGREGALHNMAISFRSVSITTRTSGVSSATARRQMPSTKSRISIQPDANSTVGCRALPPGWSA